jgi:hypothetical protein
MPQLYIALIGLGGAILGALLVAFIQPIWTNRITPKSQLQVTVRKTAIEVPKYLINSIKTYGDIRWNESINFRPNNDEVDNLRKIAQSRTLAIVTINNSSNKTIEDVHASLDGNRDAVFDIEKNGINSDTTFSNLVQIGDMKPGAIAIVKIWSDEYLSEFFGPERSPINITAKEFDKISIQYPKPDYIEHRYFIINKNVLGWAFFIFATLPWISLLTYFAIKKLGE